MKLNVTVPIPDPVITLAKTLLSKRLLVVGLMCGVLVTVAYASNVEEFASYEDDELISAEALNFKLDALRTGVNDNDARVTDLEADGRWTRSASDDSIYVASGAVGIGTATPEPQAALTVRGQIRVEIDDLLYRGIALWPEMSEAGTSCSDDCATGYCLGAYVDQSPSKATCEDSAGSRLCICIGRQQQP